MYDEAVETFEQGIRYGDSFPGTYSSLATAYVAKGEVDLEQLKSDEEQKSSKESSKEQGEFLKRLEKALGGKAKEVRLSQRLTESSACLVVEDHDMSQNLARVLQQMGQDAPAPTPILEINLDHPVVSRLQSLDDQQLFEELSSVIFDQALLAEGGKLDDPAGFVRRLNSLLSPAS